MDRIALDPEQTAVLHELLLQEQTTLHQMRAEEDEEERRVLTQVYKHLIRLGERGKHTIFDETLSWEENKRLMRQRWESGEFPEKLTWTESELFGEVLAEIHAEREREALKRQERVRRIKQNLLSHHFFWERVKTVWLHLRAAERLHILRLLQDVEWTERTVAEIRQIIENAQFFDALAEKAGAPHESEMLTREELSFILDLPDSELWDTLIDLYPRAPTSAGIED